MPDINYPFRPSLGLQSGHVQSLLSSSTIRRRLVRKRSEEVRAVAEELLLDGGPDHESGAREGEAFSRIRLQGLWSKQPGSSNGKVVVLFHGWEGSAESNYVLANSARLWSEGYDVLRFNFRDHGETHHLNPGLFHSCRLDEVVLALKDWQTRLDIPEWYLCGYSLGGNFALRVAMKAPEVGLNIRHVIGVCPVINPAHAMKAMDESGWIYQRYFERKWSRSIRKKKALFPELYGDDNMEMIKGLNARTEYMARKYNGYRDAAHYYDGYSIGSGRLKEMPVDATVLTSADDPVIPVWDFEDVEGIENIDLNIAQHGGHCGFLKNWKLDSAAEDLIMRTLLS